MIFSLLPPAYVVRREGNSFTLLVCSHPGGYPYPIMLCNISQNAMGQTEGGTLPGPAGGGTLAGGGYPGGVPCQGGPCWGGTQVGTPPARSGWGGGTQLGQHREYLLHGGRYASCVHAGGLSCFLNSFLSFSSRQSQVLWSIAQQKKLGRSFYIILNRTPLIIVH